MPHKTRHALTIVLALQCGLWVVVAPVLPQLHQAVASHRHVFCFDHARIEDEGNIDSRPLASARPPAAAAESAMADAGIRPTDGRRGSECLSSNFSAHAVFRTPSRAATRASSPVPPVRLCRDVAIQIADTLRIAPKNSPPDRA
jgi:hypothetical protein